MKFCTSLSTRIRLKKQRKEANNEYPGRTLMGLKQFFFALLKQQKKK